MPRSLAGQSGLSRRNKREGGTGKGVENSSKGGSKGATAGEGGALIAGRVAFPFLQATCLPGAMSVILRTTLNASARRRPAMGITLIGQLGSENWIARLRAPRQVWSVSRRANEDQRDDAPALSRGIAVLTQLNADGACSLERLAKTSGWPKSSVARILKSLERLGLVKRDPVSRHYGAVCRLVRNNAHEGGLRSVAIRVMVPVAREARQTVELYAFDQSRFATSLVMIDRCEPEDSVTHVRARIGDHRNLAELDALARLVRAFAGVKAPAGGHWVWCGDVKRPLPASAAAALIREAKANRMALDTGINPHGVFRYAVPLVESTGRLLGALAIAQLCTLNDKAPPDENLAALIKRAGSELEAALTAPEWRV